MKTISHVSFKNVVVGRIEKDSSRKFHAFHLDGSNGGKGRELGVFTTVALAEKSIETAAKKVEWELNAYRG